MAIGRTFKQAYLKAVRSLEAPLRYHDERTYDPWFRRQLDEIEADRESLRRSGGPDGLSEDVLRQAKVFGFSDKEIAALVGCAESTLRAKRLAAGIRPFFGEVDTCAGEYAASTPYFYGTYNTPEQGGENEAFEFIGKSGKAVGRNCRANIGEGVENSRNG